MATTQKPFIVMAAHPVNGHVQPIRLVASELVKLGYEITVLLPHAYKESFTKLPLTFVSLTGIADYTEKDFDTLQPERKFWPAGIEQMVYRSIAPTRAIFRQSRGLQSILGGLERKDPGRKIVLVMESHFRGAMPMLLRLPGFTAVPVIALGVTPYLMPSIDFPALGVRAFPDTSVEARAKNHEVLEGLIKALERGQREMQWVLEDLGLPEGQKVPHLMERFMLPETHMQMCTPSLELPRSDWHPNVRFIGGVWASDPDVWEGRPEWWGEVESAGKDGKEVIGVTQGTLDVDFTELIIPTIEALRDRQNTVVIVVLAVRGATLPKEINIPNHVHVMDYVPYSELLKYSSLFITNGGYNGVQQAVSHGVPILKAGNDGDKMPTGNRIEYAGCGLDLWTTKPAAEQVKEGVEAVLGDPNFKKKSLGMQEESKRYNPMEMIVEEIEAMANGRHADGSLLRIPTWWGLLDGKEASVGTHAVKSVSQTINQRRVASIR